MRRVCWASHGEIKRRQDKDMVNGLRATCGANVCNEQCKLRVLKPTCCVKILWGELENNQRPQRGEGSEETRYMRYLREYIEVACGSPPLPICQAQQADTICDYSEGLGSSSAGERTGQDRQGLGDGRAEAGTKVSAPQDYNSI